MARDWNAGLRILARRDELSENDWYQLLEARRQLMAPHLREMTLKTLGDLKIIGGHGRSDETPRPLRMGAMCEIRRSARPEATHRVIAEIRDIEGNVPLTTRGIFPDDESVFGFHGQFKAEHIYENAGRPAIGHIMRFWGLTRNNEWIRAECTVRTFSQARSPGYDERHDRVSEVTHLKVVHATAGEICRTCGITPKAIWERLGDAAEAWLEHRRTLLDYAERLVRIFEHEQTLIGTLE